MQTVCVTEDVVQTQQCVGLAQVQTVVCVRKAAEAELLFAQQHHHCIVAYVLTDIAQQTLVQTVDWFVCTMADTLRVRMAAMLIAVDVLVVQVS